MSIDRIDFLGLPLDPGASVDGVCGLLREKGKAHLVTFINPSAWALAKRSPQYLAALRQTSLNLPDGEGVAAVYRWLTGKPCARISFDTTSLAERFFKQTVEDGASLMLVGGKPGVDEGVHAKLLSRYPGIKIAGTHHGYGEFESKIADVIEKSPDAVIVAMGTPRQELFIVALRDAGYKGVAITCGGFFDQYLESDPYYPLWIDHWNLRFAYRLYKEPGRLWHRYLIDYPVFIAEAVKAFAEKYFPSLFKHGEARKDAA